MSSARFCVVPHVFALNVRQNKLVVFPLFNEGLHRQIERLCDDAPLRGKEMEILLRVAPPIS